MSHSESYQDTGPTTAFYQGVEAGRKQELDRILAILDSFAQHSELCADGCFPEECDAPAFAFAIALIKGEQK